MAQLTGTFQGTSQADTYLGEVLIGDAVIIDDVLTGIAATDLIIDSFEGGDVIEAIVDINRSPADPIETKGIGIEDAVITTDRGSDTLTVSSTIVSDLFVSAGTGTVVDSTGVLGSSIDMGDGRDAVSISSLAVVVNDPVGANVVAQSFGLVDSTITLGGGRDAIAISAEIPVARSNQGSSSSEAMGVSGSSVLGDRGADAISITARAVGTGPSGETVIAHGAVFGSTIDGGQGKDAIAISAESLGSDFSQAVGVGFGSDVNGGDGSDVIVVSARYGATAVDTAANIHGVFQGATVNGGKGADTIEINSEGSIIGFGLATFSGVDKANVEGGDGSDIIGVNVFGSGGANTTYVGVFQSTVAGGNGRDEITINVTGTTSGGTSVGVRQGTLEGGNGRDIFSVRGVNLDLDDAVINGGNGVDEFDTGIGTAQISGDGGNDLMRLNFFDDTTMSIALLGSDSIEITGTQDKLGNMTSWTQTITDVEQYEVAGAVYDAAGVVALLG